jgi:hypothetical protein
MVTPNPWQLSRPAEEAMLNRTSDQPDDDKTTQHDADAGDTQQKPVAEAPPPAKPVIEIRPGDYGPLAEATESAIVNSLDVFQRSPILMRPVIQKVKGARGARTNTAALIPIREFMGQAADFVTPTRKGDSRPTDPPISWCETARLIEREVLPHWRHPALPVVEKILNHVSGVFSGVSGIYMRHDFAREEEEALERWGAHVMLAVARQDPDQPSPRAINCPAQLAVVS